MAYWVLFSSMEMTGCFDKGVVVCGGIGAPLCAKAEKKKVSTGLMAFQKMERNQEGMRLYSRAL